MCVLWGVNHAVESECYDYCTCGMTVMLSETTERKMVADSEWMT